MQVIIWQDLLKCRSALKSRVQNFYGGQANIGHNIHFTFGVQEQVQSKCIEKRFLLYFHFYGQGHAVCSRNLFKTAIYCT